LIQQETEIVIRKRLRREVLAGRDSMAPADRSRKSGLIEENLWQLEEIAGATILFIYVNFRSEVETLPLIRHCLSRGKKVAVPLTDLRNSRLLPYAVKDPDQDLQPGYCGILEPVSGRLQAMDPHTIETVILPGSVFDEQGGRLGYGGGYYDRFLANDAPLARRVGIAFEQQMVEQLPLLPHDKRLHILVTEKRIKRIS
jgi:5-formyltetrahydrofolate cyclo-ligase